MCRQIPNDEYDGAYGSMHDGPQQPAGCAVARAAKMCYTVPVDGQLHASAGIYLAHAA